MRAEHVVRFDGEFSTALDAFQNAAEEPVLLVVDSTDPSAPTTIGRARAGSVVTQSLLHVSDLGPLGRTVLARLAAALAPQTDPGTLLTVLAEIEAQTRTFVLVDSPGRLHRPAPSLWQHAWGLLPGTCFLGELGGRVRAIGRRGLPSGLAETVQATDAVLYTSEVEGLSATRARALEHIVAAVSPHQCVPEPVDAVEAQQWWGPSRPLELCAIPRDIESIVRSVQRRAARCPWCGSVATTAACAVCGSATAPSITEGQLV